MIALKKGVNNNYVSVDLVYAGTGNYSGWAPEGCYYSYGYFTPDDFWFGFGTNEDDSTPDFIQTLNSNSNTSINFQIEKSFIDESVFPNLFN